MRRVNKYNVSFVVSECIKKPLRSEGLADKGPCALCLLRTLLSVKHEEEDQEAKD